MDLSKEDDKEHESCVGHESCADTCTKETLSCPKPGTFVPKELHPYLDNSYLTSEFTCKFIALELEDPVVSDDTASVADSELIPTYIFVSIIRKLESSAVHPLVQEYEIDDGTENSHVVKSFKLYKFVQEGTENIKDIPHDDMNSEAQTLFLKTTVKHNTQCLKEAWKEVMVDRRNIAKRLLLKWQPDKNHDDNQFCTQIFKNLQQCLCLLEKGTELTDDYFDDTNSARNSSDSDSLGTTGDYWSNSWFRRVVDRFQKEKDFLKQNNRSGNYDEFDGGRNARGSHFTAWGPQAYHYHAEARRWQKQAGYDMDISITSLKRMSKNSFNWVCYMAHQAAEKSMKAAWYAKDANKIHSVRYSHNLSSIASGLGSDIEVLAGRMTDLTGEHTRMRYPDAFSGQQIPAEAFNRHTAETVVSVAKQIIDIVHKHYIR